MSERPLLDGISEGDWKSCNPYLREDGETTIQIEADLVMVGEVYAGEEPEGIQNANLIAAAPKVIAAAYRLIAQYDRTRKVPSTTSFSIRDSTDAMHELRSLLFLEGQQ